MKRKTFVTTLLVTSLVLAGLYLCLVTDGEAQGILTITYINTGQGDSILIQTPDSKNILIDAGGNLGPLTIIDCLRSENVSIIDALIITHPHADHLNYSDEVMSNFSVLSIYHTGMIGYSSDYRDFIVAAEDEGCPIFTDNDIDEGDCLPISDMVIFEVLHIDQFAENANAASIVIKMTFGYVDFLFMGDAQSNVEHDLISEYGGQLDCEVLKVGHHGSSDSTSNAFLAETNPYVAIICVGVNDYGHPHSATIGRLHTHGVDVYGTYQDGTITISTDGSDFFITSSGFVFH